MDYWGETSSSIKVLQVTKYLRYILTVRWPNTIYPTKSQKTEQLGPIGGD